ncbi:MAG: thiol:disulfide interchange protein DsbA/DsbL, partial [Gammaproteobacteria bacterium]|nr:thiol:disulfide interchange protein DsbA/DsbL [Gammaproteobacteria bacterium]
AKLPNDVVFNRTPAVWDQQAFLVLAQSYYTAEALGVTDKVHLPLFNAIHGERKNLSDPQSVAAFFNQFGVDVEDFAKVYHSFGVRAATQQAIARGRSYRATGVPTLIVNGRYRVEGSHAGSNTGMLPIVELLIEKERARVRGVEQE